MPSGPSTVATAPTLISSLWPSKGGSAAALRAATLLFLGTALLTLSAKVQVPFYPVPMTMQTLVVVMIGAAYGSRLGVATVLLYLAEGFAGLSVFANTPPAVAGPAYFIGPTGGFLVGFPAAAWLVGRLAERGWMGSLPRAILAMGLGHAVIFAFGLSWLASLIGPGLAWDKGAVPFVWATLLKTALAAGLLKAAWTVVPARDR